MKKIVTILTIILIKNYSFAQDGNLILQNVASSKAINYKQLKQYEGLYEYINNSTIKLAASPRDTILYAIINESRYKLSYIEKDLFMDMQKNKIQFFRNKKNEIVGYILGDDTLKVLNKNLKFPKEMWYARVNSPQNYKYNYQSTKDDKDGLLTGKIDNTGLEKKLLS